MNTQFSHVVCLQTAIKIAIHSLFLLSHTLSLLVAIISQCHKINWISLLISTTIPQKKLACWSESPHSHMLTKGRLEQQKCLERCRGGRVFGLSLWASNQQPLRHRNRNTFWYRLLATNIMQLQSTASNMICNLFMKASPVDGSNSGPDKPTTAEHF